MNIAINGFGRIGRATLKAVLEKKSKMRVVAINDLSDVKTLAHLLKYDSSYGKFARKIKIIKEGIEINGKKIKFLAERDPALLPWKELNIDLVVESTGVFRTKEDASKHIKAGAKKVIISAGPKSPGIKTVVLGVNEEKIKKTDKIISNASCTTNCYAPITKILHDEFKVERSYMATIHAVTNDQRILDLPHKDLRRARSVLDNIIPTTSGANKATQEVIPALKGKLHAMSVRVPVKVGSVIYAIYDLKKKPSPDAVNKLMKKASKMAKYKNIIRYETDPIVCADIVGDSASAIFDSLMTEYSDDLIKIVAWYDNEWGYSSRMADLCEYIFKKRLF